MSIRPIGELGISPWPWVSESGPLATIVWQNAKQKECVCAMTSEGREQDARLIAAVPELYECLRELIEMHECCEAGCKECPYHPCGEKEHDIVLKSKYALAKSSGSEV